MQDTQYYWLHHVLKRRQGEELSGGGNHAAGELQLLLYHHLQKCPNAIVHIQNLGQVHSDLLTVLLAVLSEQVKFWLPLQHFMAILLL